MKTRLFLRSQTRGAALIVTLSLLVLVTFAVVAFFSLATSNTRTEAARQKSHAAMELGRSAEDWILGQTLFSLANSTAISTVHGVPVFSDPAIVPQREVESSLAANVAFASLLQQSRALGGTAAPHSTADPARNGGRVAPTAWSAPRLVAGNTTFTDSTAPRWFYITGNGTVQATPSSGAVARFAFNLYDLSGLLDANVAGFPSTLSATDRLALRGTQVAADLTALGLNAADINRLVEFRNPDTSDYSVKVLECSRRGFLESASGQRRFLTRQDLIRFATRDVPGVASALPYLTHFSREVAAPSWSPSTPSGSSVDYAAQANETESANRFLPDIRASGNLTLTRYRDDATTYEVNIRRGAPLLCRRFSLARLAWIGANGPVNASAAAINACFGLQWNNTAKRWDYTAGTGGAVPSIKTPAQVADENREPNFFELLKAGILSGSLGKDGGGGLGGAGNLILPSLQEADRDLQILQIGANLIDQWDADSIPTAIGIERAGEVWEAVGIESLPQLAQFKAVAGKSLNAPTNRLSIYLLANLWNPHQSAPTSAPNLRLTVRGSLRVVTRNVAGTTVDHSIPPTSVNVASTTSGPGIVLAEGLLGNGTSSGMAWVRTPADLGSYAGFRLPDYRPAANATDPLYGGSSGNNVILRFTPDNNNPFQIMLEYEAAPGVWRGYSFLTGNNDPDTWIANNFQQGIAGGYPATVPLHPPDFSPALLDERPSFARSDPRARRFTPVQFDSTPAGLFTGSLWSDTASSTGFGGAGLQLAPANIFSSGSVYPGLLARNNNAASRYADNDGITRPADSGFFTGSGSGGNPYAIAADRPVVLNRPFRSVAEMSAACRDLPWKSLDFFTALSGDSALLDLFALTDCETAMRAGVVSLNTPHSLVLQALLRGASTDLAGSGVLTDAESASLANALITQTSTTKANNPAQLAALSETVHPGGSDANRKPSRETLARALTGVVQTRTWNLFADVVYQTGRFAPLGGTNASDWIVETQSRQWITFALDRFSGEILERQTESLIPIEP